MTEIFGFPPVALNSAKVLILGSMPGIKSLVENQYYAHKQNSFWFIVEELFGINRTLGYDQRVALIREKKIALWDVLKTCRRQGSLDSAIESDSIVANDFESFFKQNKNINFVFFNGAKAEQEYKKHVQVNLPAIFEHINYQRLPSTSPAHASITRQEKLKQWSVLKECLNSEDS